MKVLTCEKCGSNDLYEENGYLICRYCGTKHLITKDDKPARESTIDLNEDVKRLLKRWDENPSQANKYAHMILEIDPNNQRALKQVNSKSSSSSGGCYIATAVYGSYDCPQVWVLRRFRDETLSKTWYGKAFIRSYYAVSPSLVKWFGKADWFYGICRPALDGLVHRLIEQGFRQGPYIDN